MQNNCQTSSRRLVYIFIILPFKKPGYSKHERFGMICILGERLQNCLLASPVYARRFPIRHDPNKAV